MLHRVATVLVLNLAAFAAAGDDTAVRKLSWEDLLPAGEVAPPQAVDHSRSPVFDDFPYAVSAGTVPDLAGQVVKLPGFVVPLDVVGGKVASFLLVPYFGACIHQPPPPPNQIVYVQFKEPVEVESMYDPVWVTGKLGLEAHVGGLAEAGYSMEGRGIEKYRY